MRNPSILVVASICLFGCNAMLLTPFPEPNVVAPLPVEPGICELSSSQSPSSFAAGAGTGSDPYVICTAEQLYLLTSDDTLWTKSFVLGASVDMSAYDGSTPSKTIHPIGYLSLVGGSSIAFTGTFDGGAHNISNVKINEVGNDISAGFFGFTDGATVSRVQLRNVDIDSANITGGLIGSAFGTRVHQCSVEGGSINAGQQVGGLIGQMNTNAGKDSSVTESHTSLTVQGTSHTGGLIGLTLLNHPVNSGISDSYTTGTTTVTSGSGFGGGLIGSHNSSAATASLLRNYSTGTMNVTGGFSAGLVGNITTTGTGVIHVRNCYSTGAVALTSGSITLGGLLGTVTNNSSSVPMEIHDSYSSSPLNLTINTTFFSVGGLIGNTDPQTGPIDIRRVYSTGNITGSVTTRTRSVGGLIGSDTGSTIRYAYATGNITMPSTDSRNVGGLLGLFGGNVAYAYATGTVQAVSSIYDSDGGFVGGDSGGTYANAYWNIDANPNGIGTGAGTAPGTIGVTLSQLQTASTFAGWDFTTIWLPPVPPGFPRLR